MIRKALFTVAVMFAFAPVVRADQQQPAQPGGQDMAQVCDGQIQQGQQPTPECQARLSCLENGLDDATCKTYCAQYPADAEACTAQTADDAQIDDAQVSDLAFDRWHRGGGWHRGGWHRGGWHRGSWCFYHPYSWRCR